MPNTKNFYLRVRILDGLLQSRKGVSIQECLRVINNRLAARDIPPVTSKDTILKDMTEIANEFKASGKADDKEFLENIVNNFSNEQNLKDSLAAIKLK